ncbi:MAG: rod shape-determining protein MreD [Minisyncoccia bacterium]
MIRKNINNYIFIPALILSMLVQFTFLPQLFFWDIFPNLTLFILISGSFLHKNDLMLYLAFFSGLAFDVFSGQYFGVTMISFLISVFISSYFGYHFLEEIFSLKLLLVSALAVIAYNASFFILMNIFNSYRYLEEAIRFFYVVEFDVLYLAVLIYPLTFLFSYNRNEK